MSILKSWSLPRGRVGVAVLVLGVSLSACAHPVVVEPSIGVLAHSGPVVVQYGYGVSAAPVWMRPPVVVQRHVVPVPVVVPASVYRPHWRDGRGGRGVRDWRHGEHEHGRWGRHGH